MKNIFESFEEHKINSILEAKDLAEFSKDIEELKSMYKNAPVLDASSRKVDYDKRSKEFQTDEKTLGQDPRNTEHIILMNPKTNSGILFQKLGRVYSKGKWTGQNFVTQDTPPKHRHDLMVRYKKPEDMEHDDKMRTGYFGPLD